jgi:hypothetical protein
MTIESVIELLDALMVEWRRTSQLSMTMRCIRSADEPSAVP